jgi:hypothetical protein
MSVFIGSEPLLERTLEVLASESAPPKAPYPHKWTEDGKMIGWVFGPVERPLFNFPEADLPY